MRTPRSLPWVPASVTLAALTGAGLYVGCTQDFDQFAHTGEFVGTTSSSGTGTAGSTGIGGSFTTSSGTSTTATGTGGSATTTSSATSGTGGAATTSSTTTTSTGSGMCGTDCSTCAGGCCDQVCESPPCSFTCGGGCMCTFDCNDHAACVIDCNGASGPNCVITGCPPASKLEACPTSGVFACKGSCP